MAFRLSSFAWAAAGLFLASTAQAQSAGTLIGRIGATQIKPNTQSGDLTTPSFPGTKAEVGSDTQPTAGLTYMFTDQVSVDLPLAAGFTHELTGAGAIQGTGKIGEVKALPITLLAQYRFLDAKAPLRPYVGLGPTYAKFYKARSTAALSALTGGGPGNPTTLTVDSKFTYTVQLGATWAFSPRWSLDVAVMRTALKTRTHLSTGQTLDATLDPTSISAGLAYSF
jgi:outer membrane protein